MLQAEDRTHRIGQSASHINILYLYGESTLDEILFPMVQFKNSICSNTLDGEKSEFKITKKRKRKEADHDSIDEDDLQNFCKSEDVAAGVQSQEADGFIL